MLEAVFALARPLLNALDPERAHELTLRSLEAGIHPRASAPDDGRLAANVWGLRFPNPLGIAAGFDKDARVVGAVLAMGLGFAEIGTVTPLPQQGMAHSSTGSVSTMAATPRRWGGSCATRREGSSASTSAPTRMRPTASPITCTAFAASTMSPLT